jgi:hypothetical protein
LIPQAAELVIRRGGRAFVREGDDRLPRKPASLESIAHAVAAVPASAAFAVDGFDAAWRAAWWQCLDLVPGRAGGYLLRDADGRTVARCEALEAVHAVLDARLAAELATAGVR